MDLQITRVQLPKEIDWVTVQECRDLFVEMMRNRVSIEATAVYPVRRALGKSKILFEEFKESNRKFLNSFCCGLYSFYTDEQHFDEQNERIYSETRFHEAVRSKGVINVLFEDHNDYARFIKDRAVMFKLSLI